MDPRLINYQRRLNAELNENDVQRNPYFVWKPSWEMKRIRKNAEINDKMWRMRNSWSPIPSKDPTVRFGWKKPIKKAVPPKVLVIDEKKRKEKGDEAVATLALEGRGPCGKPKDQCKCNDLSLVQKRWPSSKNVNAGIKITPPKKKSGSFTWIKGIDY